MLFRVSWGEEQSQGVSPGRGRREHGHLSPGMGPEAHLGVEVPGGACTAGTAQGHPSAQLGAPTGLAAPRPCAPGLIRIKGTVSTARCPPWVATGETPRQRHASPGADPQDPRREALLRPVSLTPPSGTSLPPQSAASPAVWAGAGRAAVAPSGVAAAADYSRREAQAAIIPPSGRLASGAGTMCHQARTSVAAGRAGGPSAVWAGSGITRAAPQPPGWMLGGDGVLPPPGAAANRPEQLLPGFAPRAHCWGPDVDTAGGSTHTLMDDRPGWLGGSCCAGHPGGVQQIGEQHSHPGSSLSS